MRLSLAAIVLCLSLVVLGCGGDDDATSAQQGTTATTTQSQENTTTTAEDGQGDGFEAFEDKVRKKIVIGDYPQEPPFSGIHGGKGNERPRFDPPDQPAPKKLLMRDLEVGSGPPVEDGDEVRVYYAGAIYGTSKSKYYGWYPSYPAIVRLGSLLWGKAWEESLVGMKVGGLREVIIPSNRLEGSDPEPLNYVIKLVALEQK